MSDFVFYDAIPATQDNPSNDQPLMLANNQSTKGIIAVDHVGFNGTAGLGGYHTIVHLTKQAVDPANNANAGQVYAKQTTIPSSNDWQLFYKTPMNGVEQISGNQAATNGLCFASGMRFMWGQVNAPAQGTTTAVTFASLSLPNFNNIYSIQFTPQYNGINNTKIVYVVDFNTTRFRYFNTSGASEILSFYFLAIGN